MSTDADAGSSWSGSSGGTDAGGPHSCGGAPSVTSPLPEPPQLPQPPRSAQVLLVMELADQRSLHSAISKGRLSGNMVSLINFPSCPVLAQVEFLPIFCLSLLKVIGCPVK